MSGIINCATYSDGRRVANIQIEEIGQALGERNGFIWIGLHEPSAELLKQIQSEFRLHELAIEDAHRAHQRPKLEAYGDTLFIVLRTAQMNQELRQIEFGETHFFVGCNFIVSIRHGSTRSYTDVRSRCESAPAGSDGSWIGRNPGLCRSQPTATGR